MDYQRFALWIQTDNLVVIFSSSFSTAESTAEFDDDPSSVDRNNLCLRTDRLHADKKKHQTKKTTDENPINILHHHTHTPFGGRSRSTRTLRRTNKNRTRRRPPLIRWRRPTSIRWNPMTTILKKNPWQSIEERTRTVQEEDRLWSDEEDQLQSDEIRYRLRRIRRSDKTNEERSIDTEAFISAIHPFKCIFQFESFKPNRSQNSLSYSRLLSHASRLAFDAKIFLCSLNNLTGPLTNNNRSPYKQ